MSSQNGCLTGMAYMHPMISAVMRLDSVLFTEVNERVFRDTELLDDLSAPLVGAIAYQGIITWSHPLTI